MGFFYALGVTQNKIGSMKYDLSFYFDENLQEVATKPSDMELYVQEQKIALSTVQSPID